MSNLNQLIDLREEIEELQRKAYKAEGALDKAKEQLQEDFGCRTVKAARKLLKRLQAEEVAMEEELSASLEIFQGEWGEHLHA
ncbi:unnamed protein product [marine sediment metagenome]|uniref:Uncharacterized protein n=1 Tax=marine sediment metagenome TaxID=412755 RepID=X0SB13_9ZZZZ